MTKRLDSCSSLEHGATRGFGFTVVTVQCTLDPGAEEKECLLGSDKPEAIWFGGLEPRKVPCKLNSVGCWIKARQGEYPENTANAALHSRRRLLNMGKFWQHEAALFV